MTSPDGRDIQLELLKLLAELTVFCGTIEKPEEKVQQLYNTLIVSGSRCYHDAVMYHQLK